MKKTIILLLILLSLIALTLRYGNEFADNFLSKKSSAGVRILSSPTGARVYLNEMEVGKTPYESSELKGDSYLIKIEEGEASWQGKVTLNSGTLTVVNREISKDPSSSSGEILTLEKGKGVTIISNPDGAEVEIDSKFYGKTPLLVDLEPGEHSFALSSPNYLKRSIRASLPEGFHLNLSVDLSLSEADLETFSSPKITETAKVIILATPTGFLRVREKATLSSKEVARVSPGDELVLLEEQTGWFKVRLENGGEGFVSSDYAEKKNP